MDGTPFGRYQLIERVGCGGIAEVWRAFDTVTEQVVAIKVLPPHAVQDPTFDNRFRGETHAAGLLSATETIRQEAEQSDPKPLAPKPSRHRVLALSGAAAIALVLAVVAAIALSNPGHRRTSAIPNTGPFTGTFTVDFGPLLTGAGTAPDQETAPSSSDAVPSFAEPWRLRSACAANGCVATASTGGQYPAGDIVFDDVDGRWVAVATSRGQCSGSDAERWDVVSVQAQADGHLSGEWTQVTSNGCFRKRTAAFTRVGNADTANLPDPAAQPSRVVSPAEALHGAYRSVTKYAGRSTPERYNSIVRTDCLRAGNRCMSEFLDPEDGTGTPLVFASGAWTLNATYDNKCSRGTPTQVKNTARFQLPKPVQNPIPRLAGHGFSEWTGCPSTAYDETFTRTGD